MRWKILGNNTAPTEHTRFDDCFSGMTLQPITKNIFALIRSFVLDSTAGQHERCLRFDRLIDCRTGVYDWKSPEFGSDIDDGTSHYGNSQAHDRTWRNLGGRTDCVYKFVSSVMRSSGELYPYRIRSDRTNVLAVFFAKKFKT
ncbi:hypothetical protein Pan189_09510 [Stratiformator vulcanicus]|uniref:Uncharacterized protein n=1 Tax=Stratiformator vulcanicus TaxID=2527980 RepID=A0A517QY78_9PLAN|nr:hypothetical protein Pan189_09510 [Stratiformator vulcanicus]